MALSPITESGIEITLDSNFQNVYTFPLDSISETSIVSDSVYPIYYEECVSNGARDETEREDALFSNNSFYNVEIIALSNANETREMPQLKTVAAAEKDIFALSCEWENCKYFSDDVEQFVKHVAYHMPDLEVKENEQGEEVYACLWYSCGFETADTGEIKRHVNYHSYHSKLKCVGKNVVERRPNLVECKFPIELVNEVPEFPNPFKCRWDRCGKEFNNPQIYFNHVNLHAQQMKATLVTPNTTIPCLWENCRYSFKGKAMIRLAMHIRTHSQEKLAACSKCGALFATRTKLVDHLHRQFSTAEFQCSNCSKFFSSERLLRDHMRLHVNQYKCAFCDMTCPTPRMLSNHIRFRHLTDRPFQCPHCPLAGKTLHDLNDHLYKHEGPQYECDETGCGFKCHSAYGMNKHMRKIHDHGEDVPLYCCHLCDSRFFRGAFLTNHLYKAHDISRPNGHSRFRYKVDEMGLYRLETIRYECVDMSQVAMKVDIGVQSKSQQVCVTIAQLDESGRVVEERQMLADQLAMVPVEPPPIAVERRHFQFK